MATHVIWFMAASCLPRGGNRPATDASVATGCNGSANTDQRLSPRRIDGESGRLALEGSIAYIVNHAFAKSLFFLVAGALSYSCGTRLLPRLRGVLHTLPLPGVGFCVAALAITGVPPFNGFFSKFPLFAAGFALSVEYWILLPAMILLMIESVASFACLFAGLVALCLANRARPSPMPHRCQGQCAWC